MSELSVGLTASLVCLTVFTLACKQLLNTTEERVETHLFLYSLSQEVVAEVETFDVLCVQFQIDFPGPPVQ